MWGTGEMSRRPLEESSSSRLDVPEHRTSGDLGAMAVQYFLLIRGRHGGRVYSRLPLPFRGDAFRVAYAMQFGDEIWVVHAVQKKSLQGIKAPKREIDLIKDRLKRLKEMLR